MPKDLETYLSDWLVYYGTAGCLKCFNAFNTVVHLYTDLFVTMDLSMGFLNMSEPVVIQ